MALSKADLARAESEGFDNLPDNTELSSIDAYSDLSWDDVQRLLSAGEVAHVNDVDDRQRFDKDRLVGKPMFIAGWRYKPDGDMGDFMVVHVITANNERGFFVDGSTGIKDQLLAYQSKMGAVKPVYVPNGLRKSTYKTKDETGKEIMATTYYIDNAA